MQGIVIQGPTIYYKEMVEAYKDFSDVVWSTWEDEPSENLNYIKQFFPIILSPKPSFPGYLNVNLQTVSTMGGIEYLIEQGVTEILKVRGDIICDNLSYLLSLLKGKQMAYLVKSKEGARPLFYELEYRHYSHDYPADLIMYGSSENIKSSFNFTIEEQHIIPPESLIAYQYFKENQLEFNLNYKHCINNGIHFFLQDCLDNNIKIFWLKNKAEIVDGHKNKKHFAY